MISQHLWEMLVDTRVCTTRCGLAARTSLSHASTLRPAPQPRTDVAGIYAQILALVAPFGGGWRGLAMALPAAAGAANGGGADGVVDFAVHQQRRSGRAARGRARLAPEVVCYWTAHAQREVRDRAGGL